MIKKYKLLKDLPTIDKGAIFKWNEEKKNYKYKDELNTWTFKQNEIKTLKEWFEPVKKQKKLELNMWYKIYPGEQDSMKYFPAYIFYTGKKNSTGFDFLKEWTTIFNSSKEKLKGLKIEKTSDIITNKLLIKEAKRRYPIGTIHKGVQEDDDIFTVTNINIDKYNDLMGGPEGCLIDSDLKWSEIIEKPIITTSNGAFIYAKDLIKGNFYWSNNSVYKKGHIFNFKGIDGSSIKYNSAIINGSTGPRHNKYSILNRAHLENLRPATAEEIEHLKICDKAGKYVSNKNILYLGKHIVKLKNEFVVTSTGDRISFEEASDAYNKLNDILELDGLDFKISINDYFYLRYSSDYNIQIGCFDNINIHQLDNLINQINKLDENKN